MPKFDGQEVTRRQLLARLAWYEDNYGYDVVSDDWKPRTYIELQMDGLMGYYEMTDESLVDNLASFCGLDGEEPLRPYWPVIDAMYFEWGDEPERTVEQKIKSAIINKIQDWAPDALLNVLRFVNGSPDEQLDAVDRVNPLTADDMEAYGLDPGLRDQ
jgi:hypothetical protein